MSTPIQWSVPTALSAAESDLTQKLQRSGKFYVFLRQIRGELFDEEFQAVLAAGYRPRGTRPIPPALLLAHIRPVCSIVAPLSAGRGAPESTTDSADTGH